MKTMFWKAKNWALASSAMFGTLLIVNNALAQSVPLPNPLGDGCNTLSCPLNAVIDFLYTIAIPLCSIMVLVGGFFLMTASGDPEKVTKGRKTILYAAIGFVIIMLAKGIGLLINNFFTGT